MKLTKEQIEAVAAELFKEIVAAQKDKAEAIVNTARFNNHKAFKLFAEYQELRAEREAAALRETAAVKKLRKVLELETQNEYKRYLSTPTSEDQVRDRLITILTKAQAIPSEKELRQDINLSLIDDPKSLKELMTGIIKKYAN